MLNKTLEHFRNLVSLAGADGKIRDIEKETLVKLAAQHQINPERVEFMISRSAEYRFIIPQNQEDREQQLEDMIKFALVDGDFADAEHELILSVGKKLGFNMDELDETIQKHIDNLKG